MKQSENRLDKKNCNYTFCKSCVFHPDMSKRLNLTASRAEEITGYLAEKDEVKRKQDEFYKDIKKAQQQEKPTLGLGDRIKKSLNIKE